MRDEYDFKKGERGKFYRKGAERHLPVYLDSEVHCELAALTRAKGMELNTLVNDLLREYIELSRLGR